MRHRQRARFPEKNIQSAAYQFVCFCALDLFTEIALSDGPKNSQIRVKHFHALQFAGGNASKLNELFWKNYLRKIMNKTYFWNRQESKVLTYSVIFFSHQYYQILWVKNLQYLYFCASKTLEFRYRPYFTRKLDEKNRQICLYNVFNRLFNIIHIIWKSFIIRRLSTGQYDKLSYINVMILFFAHSGYCTVQLRSKSFNIESIINCLYQSLQNRLLYNIYVLSRTFGNFDQKQKLYTSLSNAGYYLIRCYYLDAIYNLG